MTSNQAKIKVAIFDDHPMILCGIGAMFSDIDSIDIVMTATTLAELETQLKSTEIDVLVADVIAPDAQGLKLFKHVTQTYPNVEVVAYTSLNNALLITSLVTIGVKGFVNKREPFQKLVEAVKTAAQGNYFIPPAFEHLTKGRKRETMLVEISKREHQILQLIINGFLTKEIAAKLEISINTVDNHRTNLFKKFGVQNLAELIREANNLGFVS